MPKTTTEVPIIVSDDKWPPKTPGDCRCIAIAGGRWYHARRSYMVHHFPEQFAA